MHTQLTPYQSKILEILMKETSVKQAITGRNLAKRISLPGALQKDKNIRAIIHALRVKCLPICANSRGYFYAQTDEDLSKFIVKLQGRVISQEEALHGLKQSFHMVASQDGAPSMEIKITVKKAVRTETGVTYMDFPIDDHGEPVVPEGVEVM